MFVKARAKMNRTTIVSEDEMKHYSKSLLQVHEATELATILDRTIQQDVFDVIKYLPKASIDLLFIDPPYNLSKNFNTQPFKKMPLDDYRKWFEHCFISLLPLLKPHASIYVCSDCFSSTAIHLVLDKYVTVRNRISWEREKGRGAKKNWKNNLEDLWFATVSDDYTFNVDAVKLKKRVLAPYLEDGKPKDWSKSEHGNYRLTHPSNIWTDLTVPFWSMPENTEHPTQKPEKLLAKIILASTHEHDVILDPFLGSGTTSVVAKKLLRHFVGIEIDQTYACLAEKRLAMADADSSIQGYFDGIFWERNTGQEQKKKGLNAHRSKKDPVENIAINGIV